MIQFNRREWLRLGAALTPGLAWAGRRDRDRDRDRDHDRDLVQASDFAAGGMKGFVLGTVRNRDAAYFDALASTGARFGRIFFPFVKCRDCDRYGQPQEYLSLLKQILELARSRGIRLVLVGEFPGSELPDFWNNAQLRASFVDNWRSLAKQLGNDPVIAGLDLLNEPNPPWVNGKLEAAQQLWRSLAEPAISAIRQENIALPIVFEGVAGGSSLGLRAMVPLQDAQVVYSIHFYTPHDITHQGVNPSWPRKIPYPAGAEWELGKWDAEIGVGPWNRQRLEIDLRDALAFQQKHRVPIYVGEFSCVRWAPGASRENYIADCLAIFKKHGWSWSYHEFRGWPGWDAEIASADRNASRRAIDAPVMQLLTRELPPPGL